MLTREQVLAAVKGKTRENQRASCAMVDARDYSRLCDFFPVSDWEAFGLKLKEGAAAPEPKEWTEEAVKAQMRRDLEFAIEKAEDQRGISSSLMFEVMLMWMWVLEDDLLQNETGYSNYGMSLYRQIVDKYKEVACSPAEPDGERGGSK